MPGNPIRGLAAAAPILVLLAACAGTPRWEHPSLAREEWARDEARCESEARRKAEREIARDPLILDDPSYDTSRSAKAQALRFDIGRTQRALLEECLRLKGYRRARREE